MSATCDHFTGEVILVAKLKAKPGKADAVAQALKDIKASIDRGEEPDCSTYRISRYGEDFVVFEKYKDPAAVKVHLSTKYFAALATLIPSADKPDAALTAAPELGFYEEF